MEGGAKMSFERYVGPLPGNLWTLSLVFMAATNLRCRLVSSRGVVLEKAEVCVLVVVVVPDVVSGEGNDEGHCNGRPAAVVALCVAPKRLPDGVASCEAQLAGNRGGMLTRV